LLCRILISTSIICFVSVPQFANKILSNVQKQSTLGLLSHPVRLSERDSLSIYNNFKPTNGVIYCFQFPTITTIEVVRISVVRATFFFTLALPVHSGPRPLIQFRNHFSQTVGLLGRGISPSQGHYLNIGQHRHRINAYTHQTSIPRMGFEPTISASELAKAVHVSNRAATVTGCKRHQHRLII
jgi:hypothetical protein